MAKVEKLDNVKCWRGYSTIVNSPVFLEEM